MMLDALQLIITKSADATPTAIKTIQAIRAGSPIVQARYQATVSEAFNDPLAEFTADDRALIASYLDIAADEETRSKIIQVRVTPSESADVQLLAEQAGMSVADWTRGLWGL